MKISKKEKEKYAVINFYKNQGININPLKIESPEDDSHIDIIFEDEKFQIKGFPAGAEEVEGRLDSGEDNIISRQNPKNYEGKIFKSKGLGSTPEMDASLSFDETKNTIIKVINDANKQYSPDAIKDVILLINNRHLPGRFIEMVVNNSDLIKSLKNIAFKEIYLVNFRDNLKLYPVS